MGIKERKEREKEQRRTDILDAAQKVIFSKGPDKATMEDFALEAELAKGTLYLYFRSKEIILYEISKRGAELLDLQLKQAIDPKKPGLENLVVMGWKFVEFARLEPVYFNLFLFFHNIDLQTIDIPRERVEDYLLQHSPLKTLIDIIQKGKQDGSIRNDLELTETATALWSTLMGLLVVQENKREIYDVFRVRSENILHTIFDIILNGIKNKHDV